MFARSCRYATLAVVLLLVPVAASAQENTKHWGVNVSFAPNWKADKTLQEIFISEGEGTVEGSEFMIGVARGSHLGGNWSVNFVKKAFKDDQTITETDGGCDNGFCYDSRSTRVFRDVVLTGVEFDASIPFATIARRVQIGVNVGGGVAKVEGTVDETYTNTSTFTQPGFPTQTDSFSESFSSPANEVLWKLQPLMKVELEGAVLIAPGLKAKVAWGINYIGTGVRVSAVYLFGAN